MTEETYKAKQLKRFEKLDTDWKTNQEQNSEEKLRQAYNGVCMEVFKNKLAKKVDPQLKELREQIKTAAAGYNEVIKVGEIRAEYIIQVLQSRGVDVPGLDEILEFAENGGKGGNPAE